MKTAALLFFVLVVTVVPLAALAVPVAVEVIRPDGTSEQLIVSTLGFGQRPCKDWTKARTAKSAAPALAAQWALGYFSGYNAFGPANKKLFLPPDSKTLVTYLDKHCTAEPFAPIANVAHRFIDELTRHPLSPGRK